VTKNENVQWGVDWGRAGDAPCVSIIKQLPNGKIEVLAVEYGPQRIWHGLTDKERSKIWGELPQTTNEERDACVFAESIEIYLKEKNL
jgi:hypothetical protein